MKDFTTTCGDCDPLAAGRARALATLEVVRATEREINGHPYKRHNHPIWGRRFR